MLRASHGRPIKNANARLTRITTAVLDCKRRSAVIPWVDLTEAASTV